MVGPDLTSYNFQGLVSNSIQLLCENPRRVTFRSQRTTCAGQACTFTNAKVLLICSRIFWP